MEEGSLLQEALNSDHHALSNTLTAWVYIVDDHPSALSSSRNDAATPIETLERVRRELCDDIQDLEYPWFHGAPTLELIRNPPLTNSPHQSATPFLQVQCEYGLQVTDEWQLIRLLLQCSHQNSNVAIECWDGDDGPVLLVHAASVLPDWVDQVEGRHRCWIHRGRVRLIPPILRDSAVSPLENPEGLGDFSWLSSSASAIRVDQALPYLAATAADPACNNLVSVERNMTRLVNETIAVRVVNAQHTHRAALLLPRPVAIVLLQHNPHLVAAVALAFVEQAHTRRSPSVAAEASPAQRLHPHPFASEGDDDDWVWTTHTFGRTHYAMLRHTVTASWPSPDYVPTRYKNAARSQNDCAAPPKGGGDSHHLQHSLAVGVRLLAGLEYLLQQHGCQSSSASEGSAPSPWPQLGEQLRSWRNGSLEDVDAGNDGRWFPPAPDQVDSEDWSQIREEDLSPVLAEPIGARTAAPSTDGLDTVLEGVHSFFASKSDLKGVETTSTFSSKSNLFLDPTVVLNLLQATLQAPKADDLILPLRQGADQDLPPMEDPFFSAQDYRDFDGDNSSSSGGSQAEDDVGNGDGKESIRDFMHYMDAELNRPLDLDESDWATTARDSAPVDDETAESIHLLSNLLRSLASADGGSGPFQSMLQEMGIAPPDVR